MNARAGFGGLPPMLLALGFLVLTWPVILTGPYPLETPSLIAISEAHDQNRFHLPVIRDMAATWPRIDIAASPAAGPAYHFIAAGLVHAGTGEKALRLLSSLVSLFLLVTIWRHAASRLGGWPALACVTPILASPYFLGSAIWLTTDNAAWACVAIALGGAAFGAAGPASGARRGLAAAMAVAVRQIHIWLIAPLALAALFDPRGSTRRETAARLLPLALPVAVLAALVWSWGGFLPPAFARNHARGVNPAALPFALAMTGLFGLFFLPSFRATRAAMRDRTVWIALAAAATVCLVVPTAYEHWAGRSGGSVWALVRRTPAVWNRSVLMPPLAMTGAFTLLMAWRACRAAGRAREAAILLAAFASFLVAQSTVFQVWPRYFEVLILMQLVWLAALARGAGPTRAWLVGPLSLGLGQFLMTAATLYWRLLQ